MSLTLLTSTEAASVTRLTPKQLRRLADRGELSTVHLPGGNHRYRWDELLCVIEKYRLAPGQRERHTPPLPPLTAATLATPAATIVPTHPRQVRRPLCRLCRWETWVADLPVHGCHHCGLLVCDAHQQEHMDGIEWPVPRILDSVRPEPRSRKLRSAL